MGGEGRGGEGRGGEGELTLGGFWGCLDSWQLDYPVQCDSVGLGWAGLDLGGWGGEVSVNVVP
jgi:hypothetical protein